MVGNYIYFRSRTRGLAGTCRGRAEVFGLHLKRHQRSHELPRHTLSLACSYFGRDISKPVRVCERQAGPDLMV